MSARATRAMDAYSLLRGLSEKQGRPIAAHLQIADRCNHSCGHCYQVQGQKGELSLGELVKVLDDLADAGVLMLNVSGGEATLRDDLIPLLTHAKARGFAIRLYTNGYTMDDALADSLAALALHEVHISVYSDRAEEHDAVTGVPGSFGKTMAGIERLRERNVRVIIKTPVLAIAAHSWRGVGRLATQLGCELKASVEITPREDGSLAPRALEPDAEALVRSGYLTAWAPDPPDGSGDGAGARRHEMLRQEKLGHGSCGVCRSSVAVLPNGEVRPCTDTIVPLGNLQTERLTDILARRQEAAFFRELSWRDVHGCRDCDLLLACSRCHASAAGEQHDYLGPYKSACARSRARYAAGVGELTILPPAADCAPSRDPAIGPYRIVSAGVIEPIADRVDARDDALAARFPWIRPSQQYLAQCVGARGQLIPASRLGRSSELEASDALSTTEPSGHSVMTAPSAKAALTARSRTEPTVIAGMTPAVPLAT